MNHWHAVKKAFHVLFAIAATALGLMCAPARAHGQGAKALAGARQFLPPDQYEKWFGEVVADCRRFKGCDTVAADFASIVWFSRDGYVPCGPEQRCDGAAYVGPQVVVLASTARQNERTVKHEMLHLILGRGDHPRMFLFLNLGDN